MGEDIHFRMYLKRRVDGKYVNAHEICEWNPEGTSFDAPFEGRNYDVFSLFGSGRGNYSVLPSAKFGMPEFLAGSDFDRYCKTCGFYGFVWFNVLDLEKDLDDFVKKIKNPIEFLDENLDEYYEWKTILSPGKKTASQMTRLQAMYSEWYDCHGAILCHAENLLMNVKHFTYVHCPGACAKKGQSQQAGFETSSYNKAFDMDETVFLFFFDS